MQAYIKGGFWLVGAIKRGDELFTKRVFLLLNSTDTIFIPIDLNI